MHEMSLSEGVLQILERNARTQHYRRVKKVWLEIGALSVVDADAMRFSFDAVTHGTLAEDADLQIIAIPGKAWCAACSGEVAIEQRFDTCPRCNGHDLTVTEGEEMRVRELEVE